MSMDSRHNYHISEEEAYAAYNAAENANVLLNRAQEKASSESITRTVIHLELANLDFPFGSSPGEMQRFRTFIEEYIPDFGKNYFFSKSDIVQMATGGGDVSLATKPDDKPEKNISFGDYMDKGWARQLNYPTIGAMVYDVRDTISRKIKLEQYSAIVRRVEKLNVLLHRLAS